MGIRRQSAAPAPIYLGGPVGPPGTTTVAGLSDASAALKALNASQPEQRQALAIDQVDNTPDAQKPVSTAQQAALDARATRAAPAFTGAGSHLEGQSSSPTTSRAGWTYQNTATTAAAILGPQQPPSYFTHDGHRSVMVVMGDCTAQTTSSYGAYLLNLSTRDGVGTFTTSVAGVDHSSVWGLNPTVIDAMANGAVTSGFGRKLIVGEGDISVTSPYTTVVGWALLGSCMAQPAAADGFVVGDLCAANPGVIKWLHAFVVGDATSNVGYLTGAVALSGANVPGIPNYLNYRDAAGLAQALRYRADSTGAFAVDSTAAPNGVKLVPAATGQFPSVQSFGADPNPGLVLQAQGAGQVIAQSLLNANAGFYSGGTAQFAGDLRKIPCTVGTLPTAGLAGRERYVANLRVMTSSGALQAAGAGTGGTAEDDGTAWRVAGTSIQAQA